jgi:hypothetical protein
VRIPARSRQPLQPRWAPPPQRKKKEKKEKEKKKVLFKLVEVSETLAQELKQKVLATRCEETGLEIWAGFGARGKEEFVCLG